MSDYHLAQLNIAQMREPLESPLMADFVANLERINGLAESAPGFVWRLQGEDGDATDIRPLGDMVLINMSVWQDLESLRQFVFGPAHLEIMRRRREWFERMAEAYLVLWWLPAGELPSLNQAMQRLESLRQHGPSATAFNFSERFPAPA